MCGGARVRIRGQIKGADERFSVCGGGLFLDPATATGTATICSNGMGLGHAPSLGHAPRGPPLP